MKSVLILGFVSAVCLNAFAQDASMPEPSKKEKPDTTLVTKHAPDAVSKKTGFELTDVQPGSVYEKIGLQKHDVIKSFNGQPINSPTDAMDMYNGLKSEKHVKLEIIRDGKPKTLEADLKR